jgi:hypothetical protein
MGQLTPSLITCTPKTGALVDYFGRNTPAGRDNGQLAFLAWLVSSANLMGLRKLSDDVIGIPGKKRGVRLMFPQPVCVDVCTADYDCTAAKAELKPSLSIVDLDITTKYHVCSNEQTPAPAALTFNGSEFAQYCELDDAAFLQDQFSKFDLSMLYAIDKTMVTLLNTLILPAHAGIKIPILKTSTDTGTRIINDEWLMAVQEKLDSAGLTTADVVIFGGRMVRTIAQKYRIATASTEGYDITKAAADLPAMYYDRNFDTVFGVNKIVVIPKGLLQLVTFNQYVGQKAFRGDTKVLFTKTAPLGNGSTLTFDYVWERDPECDVYKYFPSLFAELIKGIAGACGDQNADGLFVFEDCGANDILACPPPPAP